MELSWRVPTLAEETPDVQTIVRARIAQSHVGEIGRHKTPFRWDAFFPNRAPEFSSQLLQIGAVVSTG